MASSRLSGNAFTHTDPAPVGHCGALWGAGGVLSGPTSPALSVEGSSGAATPLEEGKVAAHICESSRRNVPVSPTHCFSSPSVAGVSQSSTGFPPSLLSSWLGLSLGAGTQADPSTDHPSYDLMMNPPAHRDQPGFRAAQPLGVAAGKTGAPEDCYSPWILPGEELG